MGHGVVLKNCIHDYLGGRYMTHATEVLNTDDRATDVDFGADQRQGRPICR
jgi:hypothetical protein